jgi:tRNA 2-selenouridine synthase
MPTEITIQDYYETKKLWPLIDVRSPGEFEQGHIPDAYNIPLFSNEERAHVGTVYKQRSKEKAIELGYEYVTPKFQWFVDEANKLAPDGKVVVHCWRGGMRSKSFAQHLRDNGFQQVLTIIGGYKSYRRLLLDVISRPHHLQIIGGYTGSGKTHVIEHLMAAGHQTIDLEALAKHKGSAFGAIGQDQQPTSEQFENNLFEQWRLFDPNETVWLEDESCNIGKVNLPIALFQQMRQSRVFFLNIPREKRAELLAREYAFEDIEPLKIAVQRISKRLGGLVTQQCLDFLDQRQFYEVALLTLHYYDKTYLKGLSFRDQEKVLIVEGTDTDAKQNSLLLLNAAKTYYVP